MRQLKFTILEFLARPSVRQQHKMNLIGRADGSGLLEDVLGTRFDDEQRFLADRAFEELLDAGLIRPTYTDIISPEKWVTAAAHARGAVPVGEVRDALQSAEVALRHVLLPGRS